MIDSTKIFLSIPCLTERSISITASELMSKWFKHADKKFSERHIQNFLRFNAKLFYFLNIQPELFGFENNLSLRFQSGSFIGAIPLKSPISGKPLADFIVYPRYIHEGEAMGEYIELVYLLKHEVTPDFIDSIDLISKNQLRPPIYFECVKFIDLFYRSLSSKWVKFNSFVSIIDYPKNQINWKEYISYEWNPSKRLDFPCRINTLERFHEELKQLLFVFELSREIILNSRTPLRIKNQIKGQIQAIEKYFSNLSSIPIKKLIIHNSDPIIIRRVKEQGKKILTSEVQSFKAWRLDFTEVFEKYIQFIFSNLSLKMGWNLIRNFKFNHTLGELPLWGLRYLEPDLIIYKEDYSIVIDAKYKSHFYNINHISDYLKTEHRSDLHQLISYCAFQDGKKKIGFLCYPSSLLDSRRLKYENSTNSSQVSIYLFGIPISSSKIDVIIKNLHDMLINILKNEGIF